MTLSFSSACLAFAETNRGKPLAVTARFRSVVVITSPSHGEGPGFEPQRNQLGCVFKVKAGGDDAHISA